MLVTADFEFILPLIIIIAVIAGIIDKAKKAAEEAQRRMQETERRQRQTMPEATRRQLYGPETTVRRAKPLVVAMPAQEDTEGRGVPGEGRNDEDWSMDTEGKNDEGWSAPPVQPTPRRPVQARPVPPPPARTPWEEMRRQIEQGARSIEQEFRRQVEQSQQRQARPAPVTTEYERQQQRRQQQEAARRPAQPAPAPRRERPAEAPRAKAPAPPRPKRRAHPLLGNAGDVRRAIVLREVLGPPRGLE